MLNNFIYAKTKDLFKAQLNAGNVLDEAIVFIEDTKEMWNHGGYYSVSTLSENYLSVMYPEILDEESNPLFIPTVSGLSYENAINTLDAGISTLVQEVLDNEKVISKTIIEIANSVGLDTNFNYIQNTESNYISSATSLVEADSMLDAAIKEVNNTIVTDGVGNKFLADNGLYLDIGINDDTLIVDKVDDDDLILINPGYENKAVRVDELIKEAKEVFIITSDMFEQTAATDLIPTLTFTDEGWADFIKAAEANKIIALDSEVGSTLMVQATLMGEAIPPIGYYILAGFNYSSQFTYAYGLLSSVSQMEDSPAVYAIAFSDKNVTSSVVNTPSGTYIIDDYMFTNSIADEPISSFELTDEYKQVLARAISTNKVIGISNLVLYYLVQSISTSNVNTRADLPSGFSIINLIHAYDNSFLGHVYYGNTGILLRILCSNGVITVEKETMLLGSGDGTKFLADDGTYKEVSGNDNAITYRTINTEYWSNPAEMISFDSDKFKDYLSKFKDELTSPKTGEIVYLDDYTVVLITYGNDNLTKEEWYNIEVTSSNNDFGVYRLYKDINDVWTLDKSIYNYYNKLEPAGKSENNSNIKLSYIKYNTIGVITKNKTLSVDSGEIYVYQGEFSFGDTVYTITFPNTVKWSTDSILEYKANHTYQFRILNNLGVMKEFANS